MMGRQYNEEFKKQIVAASYADGESVASVARRFEVNDSAIYYWRKRYGLSIDDKVTSVAASPSFVPIIVCDDENPGEAFETEHPPTPSSWQVTISMGLERRVEIGGTFELPDLIELIRGVAA